MMKKRMGVILTAIILFTYPCSQWVYADNATVKETVFCDEKEVEVTSDPTLYMTDNFSTHYFYHLNDNLGHNWHGSCAYVAFAMLLSYYDSYWRDGYIPETYDETMSLPDNAMSLIVESPGILPENGDITRQLKNVSPAEYLEGIGAYTDQYFHLKLISMGISLGFYDDTNELDSVGISFEKLAELVNYYLYDYLNLSASDVVCERKTANETTDSDDVRAFVVAKIKQGIPVLIAMQNTAGTSAHAMVAYDYDAVKDEIYVHTGWYSTGKTHVKLSDMAASENQFTEFTSAIALVVKQGHYCTNNYTESNSTVTHCTCELEIHPWHDQHVLNYTYLSATKHTGTCIKCGESNIDSSHRFASGGGLLKRCLDCGAFINTGEYPGTIQSEDIPTQTE